MPAGGASGIRAGRAFVEVSADDTALVRGLRRAQAKLQAFGDSVSKVGAGLAKIGAVASAGIAAALKVFTSQGDALQKMALRTGVSVESLSQLGFAASQSGGSLEVLEAGIRGMQRVLNDADTGLKTASDSLAALGLTMDDLRGLNPEQQFKLIADRLSQIADPSQRAALAMEVLGKSGQKLLPLMASGAAGIEALQAEADRMGLTISGETADAAAAFGDELDRLKQSIGRVLVEIGAALAPTIQAFAQRVRESVKDIIAWVKANRETIITTLKVTAVVAASGVALLAVGKVLGALATTVGVVTGAVKALSVALKFLLAHPVVAVLAAVTAGAIALFTALKKLTSHTVELSTRMSELRQKGDDARRTDQLRIERLRQLAEKTSLNNQEMAEASKLIDALQGKYGDLGLSLDKATGRILGVANAQAKLNDAMRKAAVLELNAEIREMETNIARLHAAIKAEKEDAESSFIGIPLAKFTFDADELKENVDKLINQEERLRALKLRRKALEGGDQEAVFGEAKKPAEGENAVALAQRITAEAEAAEERNKRIADAEAELTKLHEDAARRRRSSVENEIEDIKKLAAEREKLIQLLIEEERRQPGGARVTRLEQLGVQLRRGRTDRDDEIAAVQAREAERQRREQERIDQQRIGSEKQLQRELARVRIEATKDGLDREIALIEQERAEQIEEAIAQGLDADAVNQIFDLKRQIAEGASQAQEQFDSRGTFNAAALQSLQTGPNEKLLRVNEQMRQHLQRMEQQLDDIAVNGGVAFA